MKKHLIVLSTLPDEDSAGRIAEEILRKRLAACVTVSPGVLSLYWWRGKISRDREFMLIIKTTASRYNELEVLLRELHPYEIPEITAIPIVKGDPTYLGWMEQETTTGFFQGT